MERLDRFQWTYGIYSVLIGGKIYSNREISFKNTCQVCLAVKKKGGGTQKLELETKGC